MRNVFAPVTQTPKLHLHVVLSNQWPIRILKQSIIKISKSCQITDKEKIQFKHKSSNHLPEYVMMRLSFGSTQHLRGPLWAFFTALGWLLIRFI